MKNPRRLVAMLCTIVGATTLALAIPGIASAHHTNVTGTVARPCGATAPWSATATATADAVRGKQWASKVGVDAAPTALVNYSPFVADSVAYGPFNVGTFPATKASVTVYVTSKWQGATPQDAAGPVTNSVTLFRPAATTCPMPTKDPTATEWVDGTFACGDTTVEQTRSVTTYTYTLVNGDWVESSVTVLEVRTRDLTADEITVCTTDDTVPVITVINGPADVPSVPGPPVPEVCILFQPPFNPGQEPGTGLTSQTLQPCGVATSTPPIVLPRTGNGITIQTWGVILICAGTALCLIAWASNRRKQKV